MKKSINKLSKKLRDAIIKEVPTAESINYKGVTMSNKAPQWFAEWSTNFEKKDDERWDQQLKFNNWVKDEITEIRQDIKAIKNTPTMRRELA